MLIQVKTIFIVAICSFSVARPLSIFRDTATGLTHKDLLRENRVAPTQLHNVTFVLHQQNMDQLIDILDDISNPSSENYGKHMTRQEISDLTTIPNAQSEVTAYLEASGASIMSETLNGEYITASAPVSVWEEMFDTEFHTYTVLPSDRTDSYRREDDDSVRSYFRSDKYSVPTVIAAHVMSVLNTIQMPVMSSTHTSSKQDVMLPAATNIIISPPKSVISPLFSIKKFVTPSLLLTEYNVDSNTGDSLASQAVLSAPSELVNTRDISSFQSFYHLPSQAISSSIHGNVSSNSYCSMYQAKCSKSNAGVQYLMGLSPSPTTYGTIITDLSSWLLEVGNMESPPKVISINYGVDENLVTNSEFDAFDVQAIKLSLMGVTLVAAAGDNGANSALAQGGKGYCGYTPQFPASSPYVLSVGSTMVS